MRTPNGQQSVGASLGPLSTLGDLRAEIAAVSGIQIEFLQRGPLRGVRADAQLFTGTMKTRLFCLHEMQIHRFVSRAR